MSDDCAAGSSAGSRERIGSMNRLVAFDSGPLHGTTLRVESDGATLPPVVWTDEGDYPVTYVLQADQRSYGYAGEAWESERGSCPYVDGNGAVSTMDDILAWLTATLDEIERTEHQRFRLTRSVWGLPCPMNDEDGEQCGQTMTGVAWTQGDDRYEIAPCCHLVDPEQALQLLGAEPAPDRAVLARVKAERGILAEIASSTAQFPDFDGGRESGLEEAADWIAWGHRFDAPGYLPEWAPHGAEEAA